MDDRSGQRIVSIWSEIALSKEAASIPQKSREKPPLTFKDRQRVSGSCDGASKGYSLAGADVVKGTEGRVAAPQGPGVRDPAGVRQPDTFPRVPQEPGRPCRLHGQSRVEVPGDQLPARGRRTRGPRERNAG